MQAYNKASIEFKEQEFEEDKLLFDPNSEWIKRKRRAKEKMRILLIRCSRLKIRAQDVHQQFISFIKNVSSQSTMPYQNKGSFVFLEGAKKNDMNAVLMMLEKNKYFVYDFNQLRQTCLHFACKKGHLEMALLLIEKGADINAKDSMKRTPLFYALIIENKELVKFILQELLSLKCSPWSGDNFSFLKKNLNKDLYNMVQFAKRADILCKITPNLTDRKRMWKIQAQMIKEM